MRARTWVVTVAAGLVLADASIVTLALPELLRALDTTVEGVAAVIAVYTGVLALSLIPAERVMSAIGAARVGAIGFALLALASVACAISDSLTALLAARALQASAGAVGLVAAFELIGGGTRAGRRHWLGAAVLASAVGPALGGALTQAFDWRAIFVAQVPFALAGAAAAGPWRPWRPWRAGPVDSGRAHPGLAPGARASSSPPARSAVPDDAVGSRAVGSSPAGAVPADAGGFGAAVSVPARTLVGDGVALALLSGALTAVLFGLVLLLIAGWAVEPLAAAATVTVLPLAALAGARLGAGWSPRVRALGGSLLVGGGVLALAWLPSASVAWTFAPQALAGVGMGMALPAFAGELLPERTAREAARLLTVRHVGIALVLIALAPLIAHRLDIVTERAQEQGVALVLDARLPPQDKLTLAPALLGGVEAERPRAGLRQALQEHGGSYTGEERTTYDQLARRADEVLVGAVGDAFRIAFAIAGALALLAAAALALSARAANVGPVRHGAGATAIALIAALAAGLPIAYAGIHARDEPRRVALADPCEDRELPGTGGISGFLQDRALEALDAAACRYGSSREELVLGLADERGAERFEQRHGVDPRSVSSLLEGLIAP